MAFIEFNKSLLIAAISIGLNPLLWNIAARSEYNKKTLTKLANGNSLKACYALAACIFVGGIVRDLIYQNALKQQPTFNLLLNPFLQLFSKASFVVGSVFVLSSMYKLGIVGTYLGDYFGFLLPTRVTGFPFSVTENPMYNGSALCFLSTALRYGKLAGLLLTLEVFLVYRLALMFEEPFTAKIYAARDQTQGKKST
ncbi:phosphatidyl-N-methylethanolamine N- methyltransferase [Schizosaccharomyces cryophilus OY26]|uniref:Phosphatidyl-N-methylethanolamine N-methyltransferase n=1 Tax=Schizosaccharomyces cryophilus (strain OY26 / ATCC MYA-4695 / CBS 11777 / NBRC 106824 / NRRL Y48691) TaxID=653667 RepID=S9X6L9_SCHCR|nr:phosphatidyl-N-methylethanolamine N- methyltransferase [Schizosaccharomyces cryophilus OY26]EPY49411.1 phosphatidyl-N-methylethanolamine N- methyltransferase [Schizosaccharomyces cryophilus OY26]